MEREKETHKTGIPQVRILAVSGPARPTKEQLQNPGPAGVQTQDEGTRSGRMSILKYEGDVFT